jgi:hypothetical protein
MRKIELYVSTLVLAGVCCVAAAAQQSAPLPSSPEEAIAADPAPETAPTSLQSAVLEPASASAPKPAQQGNVRAVPVQSTADAPEIANSDLRPIEGELEENIDSKTAKSGDPVFIRTTESVRTTEGTTIPKGSRLVGRVVDASPAGDGNRNSKITIQFEKAELKDGKKLVIQSVLQSVTAPAPGEPAADAVGTERSETGRSAHVANGATATGSSRGVDESSIGGSAVSEEPPSQTAGLRVTRAVNVVAGNTASKVGTVVAQQGSVAVQTTAIPGVLIATNASGKPFSNAAGVILGAGRDIRLESGTHVVLAISDAGTKGTNAR